MKECWQTASTTSLDSHSENSFSRPMRGIQVRRSSPIRRAISRDSRALGASRSGLLRLVVMQAARLIVLGGALGLVAAFAASKLLASLQVGVTSPDAVSFSLAWALMTAVAVVASEPRGCTPSSRWRWAGLTVTCISSRLEGPLTPNPGFDLDTFEDDPKISDERQTTFQKIAPKLKSVLVYEYDFGDSWDYFITVEKILPADPAVAPGAECLDDARACPPEDCEACAATRTCSKSCATRAMTNTSRCWAGWAAPSTPKSSIGTRPTSI